ncbi:MAG: 2-hydroxyacid dehydrogenase [Sphingobacteriales bacterium JAD_PAG50586_3]|nr:MAG: 2-hydroxyacid dehydrogenase [Sphingobacteriales bacterium JAD_PAG50586_3]
MKLAVLNNSALQETHINRLKQLGDVSLYESIIGELDAISKLKNCEIAVIDSIDVPITEGFLKALPHLKFICLNSTGFEQVDLKAADHHGVIVSNIPDYSTHSVAEHCIALMLSIVRKIPQSYFDVLRSPFEIDLSNKEHNKYLGENLHNKTLGIIGMGRIGSQLAYIAKAFGMNVIPYTRQDDPIALEQLYLKSDFISINSSYSLQPSVLIDERVIPKLKPNCVIINTSRGEFVNESDIAKALKEMRLGGMPLMCWVINQ